MYVERCPICGYAPKIEEWCRDRQGRRRYFIGCRNLCFIINKPYTEGKIQQLNYGIIHIGATDDNTLYKLWNKAIKENNNA